METPALQTNFPAVRFVAFTRTELVPAGRLFGSCPDRDQFPLESLVDPSSVAITTPAESRTCRRMPRLGLQTLAVLSVPFAFPFPDLLNFGLLVKKTTTVFFFFLPASASALKAPMQSASTAIRASVAFAAIFISPTSLVVGGR